MLPAGNHRAALRGFGFTIGIGLGAVVWVVFSLLNWPQPWMAGALMTIAVSLLAFLKEDLAWRLYRAWNKRLAQPAADLISRVIMGICYFIVIFAAGRSGSRLFPHKHGSEPSAWRSRSALPPEAYHATFAGPGRHGGRGWWLDYFDWARRSGNLWAVCLLPFLAALRLFAPTEEREMQGNIYTLF